MSGYAILGWLFIGAIIGFVVGSWLDSIRWREMIEEMEKKLKQDE